MRCPWCTGSQDSIDIPELEAHKVKEHLIVTETDNGCHVHGPFENHNLMRRLVCMILKEASKHGLNCELTEKDNYTITATSALVTRKKN